MNLFRPRSTIFVIKLVCLEWMSVVHVRWEQLILTLLALKRSYQVKTAPTLDSES